MNKEIGIITDVSFGAGGYDGAMTGFSFGLGTSGSGWGCADFWGWWTHRSKGAKWSKKSRESKLGSSCMRVAELLKKAKKRHLSDLKGVPIEAIFEGGSLKSWRILEEAI